MNKIYTRKNIEEESNLSKCEVQSDDIEFKFLEELSKKICKILRVGWNDNNMVNLFISCLEEPITGYKKGLLYQYEQYLFDKAIERLRHRLDIKKDINYNHALHARLADIVDELEAKINVPQQSNQKNDKQERE